MRTKPQGSSLSPTEEAGVTNRWWVESVGKWMSHVRVSSLNAGQQLLQSSSIICINFWRYFHRVLRWYLKGKSIQCLSKISAQGKKKKKIIVNIRRRGSNPRSLCGSILSWGKGNMKSQGYKLCKLMWKKRIYPSRNTLITTVHCHSFICS